MGGGGGSPLPEGTKHITMTTERECIQLDRGLRYLVSTLSVS